MPETPLYRLIERRLKRRGFLGLAGSALYCAPLQGLFAQSAGPSPTLTFTEIAHGSDAMHHLPPGYRAQVLLRWGDALLPAAPAWDVAALSAEAQAMQFGYNNDFLAFMPLATGDRASAQGLLCVNHEYSYPRLMWPGITRGRTPQGMTAERVAVELAAVGFSIVEIQRSGGRWEVIRGRYNRRITGHSPVAVSGPAAGHPRLATRDDTQGRRIRGILGPCAGGRTPWGTVLSAEENFQHYFNGRLAAGAEAENHRRSKVGYDTQFPWWSQFYERFDVLREPNEANRFGWVVEIDPHDPASTPVKRTALGRFSHESATVEVNYDGRVVVYSGDDARFEYLYRFVSDGVFDPERRDANRDLLDSGTLSVARFAEDGSCEWLPLRHGVDPLTERNGFASLADVMIECRRAADLLGATPMDRPEDIDVEPSSGTVFVALTNNRDRTTDQTDAVNPRGENRFGHILMLLPPRTAADRPDHTADRCRWEIFLLAGDPRNPAHGAWYHGNVSENGWLASPDNFAFDPSGRLWIASDQGSEWGDTGMADGLWGCELSGPRAGETRRFFRAPVGAEVCGPAFTPDGRTLFLSIQHPGADGIPGGSSFDNPATRWPDFEPGLPPRPSVLAITREDGGLIGS